MSLSMIIIKNKHDHTQHVESVCDSKIATFNLSGFGAKRDILQK